MGRRKAQPKPEPTARGRSSTFQSLRGSMASERGNGDPLPSYKSSRHLNHDADMEGSPKAIGRRANSIHQHSSSSTSRPTAALTSLEHDLDASGSRNGTLLSGPPRRSFRQPPPPMNATDQSPMLHQKSWHQTPNEQVRLSPPSVSPTPPAASPSFPGGVPPAAAVASPQHTASAPSPQVFQPQSQHAFPMSPAVSISAAGSNRASPLTAAAQGGQNFYTNSAQSPYMRPPPPQPYHLQPLPPNATPAQQQQYQMQMQMQMQWMRQQQAMAMMRGVGPQPPYPVHNGGWPMPMNGMGPNTGREQSFAAPQGHLQQMMYQQQQQYAAQRNHQPPPQAQPGNARSSRPSFAASVGPAAAPSLSHNPPTAAHTAGNGSPAFGNVPNPQTVPPRGDGVPPPMSPPALQAQLSMRGKPPQPCAPVVSSSVNTQGGAPTTASPPPATLQSTAVPAAQSTGILNRESSFKKQKAPASAFPPQPSSQAQQPEPAAAAVPQVQPPGILNRESSFRKQNGPASAFPPQQSFNATPHGPPAPAMPQAQPAGILNRESSFKKQSAPASAFSLQQQQQSAVPQGPVADPAGSAPVTAAPLVRTTSILNRKSSFKGTKIESAADTKRRLEAELAKKQAEREAEAERARQEQLVRDAEMRRLKEERLRRVMEKQRLRGEGGSVSSEPLHSSETFHEEMEEAKAAPAAKKLSSDDPTTKQPSAPAQRQRGATQAAPLAAIEVIAPQPSSPPRLGSADSNASHGGHLGDIGSIEQVSGTSLFSVDDAGTPRSASSPKPPPAQGSSHDQRPVSTVSQTASAETGAHKVAEGKEADTPVDAGTSTLQRSATLVLYELPLRRRKSGEKDLEKNPVKTYGKDCSEIRVDVAGGAEGETANFSVDELVAHRKSSTSVESKLLKKIASTVASGRSACVFSADSAKLTPAVASSPLETPSWFSHQRLVNDLADSFLSTKRKQEEEDFTELSLSLGLIRPQRGGSTAVVDDLLQDSASAKPVPLQFCETPLLGKRLKGITSKRLEEEGDCWSVFARAQSNASRVLCGLGESADATDGVVFVLTCTLTQRTPGRLPNLADGETWCSPEAEDGLGGGFMEDSDTDDVDAPDFLSREPQPTHALRDGEGDVVRSCLTIVAVDDRFPLLLAPAEEAGGKLPTSFFIDPCLRSWLSSLMTGPTLNVVLSSIDPGDADAAAALNVQKTVASIRHRRPHYNSCRRALARELTVPPPTSAEKKAGAASLNVTAFVQEVERCRTLSGYRLYEEEP